MLDPVVVSDKMRVLEEENATLRARLAEMERERDAARKMSAAKESIAVEMMKERDAATARADEVEEVCRLAQEDRIALLAAEASFANAERRMKKAEVERDAALRQTCTDPCCKSAAVFRDEAGSAIARAEKAEKCAEEADKDCVEQAQHAGRFLVRAERAESDARALREVLNEVLGSRFATSRPSSVCPLPDEARGQWSVSDVLSQERLARATTLAAGPKEGK